MLLLLLADLFLFYYERVFTQPPPKKYQINVVETFNLTCIHLDGFKQKGFDDFFFFKSRNESKHLTFGKFDELRSGIFTRKIVYFISRRFEQGTRTSSCQTTVESFCYILYMFCRCGFLSNWYH